MLSHLIKIYAVYKFSYFRLWYLKSKLVSDTCILTGSKTPYLSQFENFFTIIELTELSKLPDKYLAQMPTKAKCQKFPKMSFLP